MRSAYLLTGHRADAEDLVQTALAKVVPRWERIDGDPERYVRRVLVHENVTRWRRRRWREVATDVTPETGRDGHEAATDDRLALRQALGALSPRQRAVVVLRFYEDLPVAEVADLLGCSPGTVKSQTHDAVARLRSLLPDLPGWEQADDLSPAAAEPARGGTPPTR
ncbi:MAG: SigE family RNA polymerase sigma factor [Nocardioides sp.]